MIDTLNQSLKSYVFEDDKDSFNRNINGLFDTRIEFLVKQIPENDPGMSPDDAAEYIENKRNELPGFTSKSRRRSASSDITDDSAEERPNKRSRRTRTINESVEDEVPVVRQRMPRKAREPPSIKKSMLK